MLDFEFTYKGFNFKRVNKITARRAFENGLSVVFCPRNTRPFGVWSCGCPIMKTEENNDFYKVLNAFEYYNCNSETGRYTAFYIPVTADGSYDYKYLES